MPTEATTYGKGAGRFAITCEPCRFGRHHECPLQIVISTGAVAGVHRCACTTGPHPTPPRAA